MIFSDVPESGYTLGPMCIALQGHTMRVWWVHDITVLMHPPPYSVHILIDAPKHFQFHLQRCKYQSVRYFILAHIAL